MRAGESHLGSAWSALLFLALPIWPRCSVRRLLEHFAQALSLCILWNVYTCKHRHLVRSVIARLGIEILGCILSLSHQLFRWLLYSISLCFIRPNCTLRKLMAAWYLCFVNKWYLSPETYCILFCDFFFCFCFCLELSRCMCWLAISVHKCGHLFSSEALSSRVCLFPTTPLSASGTAVTLYWPSWIFTHEFCCV